MKKKTVIALLAVVLVLGLAVGGTVAYLFTSVSTMKNTFSIGKVEISLTETGAVSGAQLYQMNPGDTKAKDPKVTVKAGSEACYLFVQVQKSKNFDNYVELSLNLTSGNGWTKLTSGVDSSVEVYYRTVAKTNSDVPYQILAGKTGFTDGYATLKSTVTTFAEGETPEITFKAAAIQQENLTVAQAWAQLNTSGKLV